VIIHINITPFFLPQVFTAMFHVHGQTDGSGSPVRILVCVAVSWGRGML